MTDMVGTTRKRSNGLVKFPHQGPENTGCLANAGADPMAASVMAEPKTANSCQRRGIVAKAGRAMAPTCLDALNIGA